MAKRTVPISEHVRNKDNPAKPVSLVREHTQQREAAKPKEKGDRSSAAMGLQDVAAEGAPEQEKLDMYKLKTARLRIQTYYPFFAELQYRLPVVESRSHQTFAIDKYGRIYINPSYANALTVEKYAAALLHEYNHFLRDHHGRFEGRWGTLSNLAGDCEINDDLKKEENVDVDSEWIFPHETFKLPEGELAEWYFEHIPRETKTCPDCGRRQTKYIFVGKEKVANNPDATGKGVM